MDNNRDTPDDWERRDSPPKQPPPGAAPARRALAATGASLAIVAAGIAVIWIGTWVEQRVDPSRCSGSDWNCISDPTAAAYLTGYLIGAPAAVAATVLTWMLWIATRHEPDVANRVATWIPAMVLAALLGGWLLVVLASSILGIA